MNICKICQGNAEGGTVGGQPCCFEHYISEDPEMIAKVEALCEDRVQLQKTCDHDYPPFTSALQFVYCKKGCGAWKFHK